MVYTLSIGISIIPIPWIQTDKNGLRQNKFPLTPALSPPIFVAGRG